MSKIKRKRKFKRKIVFKLFGFLLRKALFKIFLGFLLAVS